MKKFTALLLAAAMSLSLAACGGSTTTTTTTTTTGSGSSSGSASDVSTSSAGSYDDLPSVELVGADSTGKGAAGQLFGELVAARVDEITGGKLTIDYHPNGDLGGDADLLRQMQSNDIQLVVCQTAPVVSFVSDVAVFDLPMVFAKYDGETIDKVLNGDSEFAQTLGASFNDAGFQLLGTLQNATYRLTTSNTNLQTLADFKGLKIRTMENSNHMAFWTAIGAEPTPLAFSELYFSLQSGAVTAEENAADTIVGNSFNEVQKYLACTNHILYANMMTMNKDAWDSLDPLYQAALQEAVAEALDEIGSQLATIDQDNKDALVSKGMELIEYDESFFDEVLAVPAVQDLYTQIDASVNGLGTILQNELAEG
jgi:tripartite ATP-independent transporter DctP family solute receptor